MRMRVVVTMAVVVIFVVIFVVAMAVVMTVAMPLGGHGGGWVVFASAARCRCRAIRMAVRGVGMGGIGC